MLGDVNVREKGGFTLIELAIVLIIIGLILGAVLKGRNLIESAKIKKAYTHFVRGWELAVLNYQDRTGQLLGDGVANGGTAATPDGNFDNVNLAGNTNIIDRLKAVGLTPPTTNTGDPGTYSISGKYYTGTMHAYLYHIHSNEDGTYYNALYILYVPTDVAIALDTIIDGSDNASAGLFRMNPDNQNWPDASTTNHVNVFYIIK